MKGEVLFAYLKSGVLAALLLLLTGINVHSAEVFWINNAGGNWNEGSNWSSGNIPGSSDDVKIVTSGTYSVILDGPVNIRSLEVGGGAGTQTLNVTLFTLTVSQNSRVNTNGVLVVDRGLINTSVSTFENDGRMAFHSARFIPHLLNRGYIGVENFNNASSEIEGTFTNGSTGTVQLIGNASRNALFSINNGGSNNGLIDLTSTGTNFVAHLRFNEEAFSNAAGGRIRSLSGNGGNQMISVNSALNNYGSIEISTNARISNSGEIRNEGSISATGATLTVFQALDAEFRNYATLATLNGNRINIQRGNLHLHSGSLSGDGVFDFYRLDVQNGPLSIDGPAFIFSDSVQVHQSSPIVNNGSLSILGNDNLIESTIHNATGATFSVAADTKTGDAFLSVQNNVINFGTLKLEGTSTTSLKEARVEFGKIHFTNYGLVQALPATGTSTRTFVFQEGARFHNTGNIEARGSDFTINLLDATFNSADGNLEAKSAAHLSFFSYNSSTNTQVVTLAGLSVSESNAAMSFSFSGPGRVQFPAEAGPQLVVRGNLNIFDAELAPGTAHFGGNGKYNLENVLILNDFIPAFSASMRLSGCTSVTGATVGIQGGAADLLGPNIFNGPVAITNAILSFTDNEPSRSAGQAASLQFNDDASIESAFIIAGPFVTTALIQVANGATLDNNGTIIFTGLITGANIVVESGATFINSNLLSYNNHVAPAGIIVNGGTFVNNGSIDHNSAQGPVELDLRNTASFNNTGRLRFFSESNAGTQKIRLTNASTFTNSGNILFDSPVSPASITLEDGSTFNQNGALRINSPLEEFSISSQGSSSFHQNGLLHATAATIRVDLPDGQTPDEQMRFQHSTNSSVVFNAQSSMYLSGSRWLPEGLFDGQGTVYYTSGTISGGALRNTAELIFAFSNALISTSVQLHIAGPWHLQGNNEIHSTLAIATSGSLRMFPVATNASGSLLLRSVHNAGAIIIQDYSSSASVTLAELAQFNNSGSFEFHNLATAATVHISANSNVNQNGIIRASSATVNFIFASTASLTPGSTAQILVDNGEVNFNNIDYTNPPNAVIGGNGTLKLGDFFVNQGTISPGNSPGSINVVSPETVLDSSSVIRIEINGTVPNIDFDQFKADQLVLGGTLNLEILELYTPEPGDELPIITFTSRNGDFHTVSGLVISDSLEFKMVYTDTSIVLQVVADITTVVDVNIYLEGLWNGSTHQRTPAMLELRSGASLFASDFVTRASGLIDTDGLLSVAFPDLEDGDYWVVFRHGGGLPVASATQRNLERGGNATLDFRLPANVFNGFTALKQNPNNCADCYLVRMGDMNGDQQLSADDFLLYFLPNFGLSNPGQVPALD